VDPGLQAFAVESAAELGAKEAIPRIVPLLKRKDPNLWKLHSLVVGLDIREAIPVYLEQLGSDDESTRRGAASCLASFGVKEAVPHLLPLLNDEDRHVRWSVLR